MSKIDNTLLGLIQASLEGDLQKIELAALTIMRQIRKENPEIAEKINELVRTYMVGGRTVFRGSGSTNLPLDPDTRQEMVKVVSPDKSIKRPVLARSVNELVDAFIEERLRASELLEKGIRPSNSLLFYGLPGTGKTMLAYYVASSLGKDLVILDLSASISSLLGKTGANLKKVLNYARETASVILLDEFDAIAKKRDDISDVGEIKRVVNILLMELENWPIGSVLIATTNHPELLDRAIWRRFDHAVELNLPTSEERKQLLNEAFQDLALDTTLLPNFITIAAMFLEGTSASDVCKFGMVVKRRMVIKNESFHSALLGEFKNLKLGKGRSDIYKAVDELFGNTLSVREKAELLCISPSNMQYHRSKSKKINS